jgi:phosphoribosyl 1,2-cyclic phosphodiesterase
MSKPELPLRVTFHGVRGSTPSPGMTTARYGGNTSCVEVRAGDQILILDAGTGIRAFGSELIAEFGSKPIEATLLISHTHWDHIQGLPFFAPAYSPENRIHVMAAKGVGATIEHGLHNQMDPINFPVGLDQLRGLTKVEELASDDIALGAFTLGVTRLNHPGGCAGFRIEANGASLAYLPDHEPFANWGSLPNSRSAKARTDALIEFIRGVDLLILDTQYTEVEYQQRRGWGHGCLPDSVSLAVHAGVRQLAFFHHDPGHSDDQIDAMVETAMKLAASTPLLVSGAVEGDKISFEGADLSLVREPFPARTGQAKAGAARR